MAISGNTLLEAHARTLWDVFLFYSLGRMVIWRPWICRAHLVERVMAVARFDAVWNHEQKKMGGFWRPTMRRSWQGKSKTLKFHVKRDAIG